ncbi:MAG: hypothetical protein QOD06_369 [Candidatus Binatota bacterium]|nr:hypothetical protein [Candidatus Binatota bacterium]
MKVALVHDFDERHLFGVRHYASRLRQALDGRCELIEVHPRPRGRSDGRPAGPLLRLFVKEVLYPLQVRRVAADVVHVIDQSHANLIRAVTGCATVVTCHDLFPLASGSWARRAGYRRRVASLARATRVIAVSEATRAEVVDRLGVSSTRAVVVRNRVDEFFLSQPTAGEVESILAELGLREVKYVLHVGASFPYKNLERAILALAELGEDRPLLVKAGAALTAAQCRLAATHGVRTRALGEVDPRTLRALYRGATALLYPSLHEGFGWPVAEALACGTPVVTSSAGGLREVTAGAAVEVDPRNVAEIAAAIRDVTEREELRRELSRRALARGSELGGGDVGAEVLAVYRAAASESRT